MSGNPLSGIDNFGLKEVKYENCLALLKLIKYEKNTGIPIPLTSKYNMFSLNEDIINLNASFESIGGKVDIDWMLRSSAPIPRVGSAFYYMGKPSWNIINMGATLYQNFSKENKKYPSLFTGMEEEGHKNAPLAAAFYWENPGMTFEIMFAPAITNCNCMIKDQK